MNTTVTDTPRLYTHAPTHSNQPLTVGIAILASAFLFLVLPILHILNQPDTTTPTREADTTSLAPPMLLDPPKPPIDKKEKLKEPEIDLPPPPVMVIPIDAYLNPKSNGIYIDSTIAQISDTASTEIAHILSELDSPPRALISISPNYPYAMKGINGRVTVEFIIQSDGRASRARVLESSHREFNTPALEAVMKSKWKAGQIDGEDVNTIVRLPIIFNSN